MTREKEIAVAFYDYRDALKLSTFGDFEYINIQEAFEEGAKWADNHPINVWHDASEEPNKYEYILFEYISNQNELKYFAQYVTKNTYGILQEFEKYGKCSWAYISDLLPKGGEK